MNGDNILILGGYGNVGRRLARLLLEHTRARLVIAGRTIEKAHAVARTLNGDFQTQRAVPRLADASDPKSLSTALKDATSVVMASSTAKHAATVARAALAAGADYLDLHYTPDKAAEFASMAGEIERAGRCFITETGISPGLVAPIVRYAAARLDALEEARVGGLLRMDWSAYDTGRETVEETLEILPEMATRAWSGGRWRKAGRFGTLSRMDFGEPFGRRKVKPLFLEEMRSLPRENPSLSKLAFHTAGLNWFVDWLVVPPAAAALGVWPERAARPAARVGAWGLRHFSRSPYGTVLKVEAEGRLNGSPTALEVVLRHDDGYDFAAASVAACVQQYLDGTLRKPGLHRAGSACDPERLFEDLHRLGVTVTLREMALPAAAPSRAETA